MYFFLTVNIIINQSKNKQQLFYFYEKIISSICTRLLIDNILRTTRHQRPHYHVRNTLRQTPCKLRIGSKHRHCLDILRYNNSTSAAVPYIYDKGLIELVSLNSIIFQVHKNIGISGGVNYHYRKGFMPSLGIHLSYSNPSLLLALTPCANFMPWANMEVNAVAEFKPVIVDDLRLLTRAQACFGYDFSRQERERAKFYCRLGLMYKKVAAGFGINIDYYRPSAEPIDNYGLFIRLDI